MEASREKSLLNLKKQVIKRLY